ncbi:MAG: hypothetical protein WA854_05260, partial [Candidatus Binataceae bacterium]
SQSLHTLRRVLGPIKQVFSKFVCVHGPAFLLAMAVKPSRSLRTASGMPRSAGSRTLANRVNQFAWIFHLEKYGLQVAGFGNWTRRIPALIDQKRSIDLVPFSPSPLEANRRLPKPTAREHQLPVAIYLGSP